MYFFSLKNLLPQLTSFPAISGFSYQELLALEPQDVQNVHFPLVPSRYAHNASL